MPSGKKSSSVIDYCIDCAGVFLFVVPWVIKTFVLPPPYPGSFYVGIFAYSVMCVLFCVYAIGTAVSHGRMVGVVATVPVGVWSLLYMYDFIVIELR